MDDQRTQAQAAIMAAIRHAAGFARGAHPHFVKGDWQWDGRIPTVSELESAAKSLLWAVYDQVDSPRWDGHSGHCSSGRLTARLSRDVAGTWHATLSVEPFSMYWAEGEAVLGVLGRGRVGGRS